MVGLLVTAERETMLLVYWQVQIRMNWRRSILIHQALDCCALLWKILATTVEDGHSKTPDCLCDDQKAIVPSFS